VTRFVLQRVGLGVLLMLAISMLTFGAMNVLGDPLFNVLGPVALGTDAESLEKIAAAEAEFHLDDPLPVRDVKWLGGFVTGDFGVQFGSDGEPPVSDLIAERLPRTLALVVMAQLMAVVMAIPWSLWSVSRVDEPVDRLSTTTAFALIAIPNFALAVILRYVLSIRFEIFPLAFNAQDPVPTRLWQLVLPAFTIALPAAAVYQRLLRTDLITTLQEDFILTARSKGISKRDVLLKHALRPSLFSFITIFGINTGALIGGALIVEQIFIIPGIGSAIVEAVVRDDFPVVLAIVMIVTFGFIVLNLIVDVLYTVIDPRVRHS
jgi:peptide/nickel transport system permease protein